MNGRTKKGLKKLVCAGMVILAIVGCAKANLVDSNSVVEDGIEYYIQTNKSVYDLGEDVELLYRITNLTDENRKLGGLSPVWDITVSEQNADDFYPLWSWSLHHPSEPPGPAFLYLDPHESLEITEIWPQIDDNLTRDPGDDTQVPPGIYKVTGVLNPPLIDVNPSAIDVAVDIRIVPEPTSLPLFAAGLPIVYYISRKRRN